jgi:hypothetical protein
MRISFALNDGNAIVQHDLVEKFAIAIENMNS